MNKWAHALRNIGTKVVLSLFGLIILYLTLLSVCSTCVEAGRIYEDGHIGNYVYFLPDNPFKHLAVFVGFVLLSFLIYSCHKKIHMPGNMFTYIMVICIAFCAVSVGFILFTRFKLVSDSDKVMKAAYEFMAGDFHQFEPGGYMFKNPHQSGFMLYMCGFILVFGESAGLIMQIINAAAMAVAYYHIARIVYLFWEQKTAVIVTVLLMAVSMPMIFYTTFVYGIYIGFMFAVMAMYQELMFFRDEKIYRVFLTALFMSLSIILKENFLIILIAVFVLGIIELFHKGKIKLLLQFAGIVLVGYLIGNQLVDSTMSAFLGFDLPKGLPATAYITMGVEEGVVSPGSYNGRSGEIYEENDWDYDAANRAAKEEIAFVMGQYIHDWRSGLDFFGRKQASQWNEPSFQCFCILWGRGNGREIPEWIQSVIAGKISVFLLALFNLSQTLVLVGVCLYLFLCRKEIGLEELLFAVIFIGGFLFHTFWEAKSQYTMLYFMILIPYMVKGYSRLLYHLTALLTQFREKKGGTEKQLLTKRALIAICVIIIMIPAAIRISKTKTFRYIFMPISDEALLIQYEEIIDNIKGGQAYFY